MGRSVKPDPDEGHPSPDVSDSTINDITRSTRTLGEEMHEATRALIRRGFTNIDARIDEIERRMDTNERRRRDEIEELRRFMKPGVFGNLTRALDQIPATVDKPA